MKSREYNRKGMLFFLAPEYGGDAVTGGGHPADSVVPASEAIDDAFGQNAGGHGNNPGPGEPGNRSDSLPSQDEIAQRAQAIWEEEGRPEGRAEVHWRRAETELAQGGQ